MTKQEKYTYIFNQASEFDFDNDQLEECFFGIENNIDITIYATPEFDADQMERIRNGLEAGLDVSIYAKPEFNSWQMDEIIYGLEIGVDVTLYADPSNSYLDMKKIRRKLVTELPNYRPSVWAYQERLISFERICDYYNIDEKNINFLKTIQRENLHMYPNFRSPDEIDTLKQLVEERKKSPFFRYLNEVKPRRLI